MNNPLRFRKLGIALVPAVVAAAAFVIPSGPVVARPFQDAAAATQENSETTDQLPKNLAEFRQLLKDKGPEAASQALEQWSAGSPEYDRPIYPAFASLASHYAAANQIDPAVQVWQRSFNFYAEKIKADQDIDPVFAQYMGSSASTMAIYSQRSKTLKDAGQKALMQAIELLMPQQLELSQPNPVTSTMVRLLTQAKSMAPSPETEKYTDQFSQLVQGWFQNNSDDVQSHATYVAWQTSLGESNEKLMELVQASREKFPQNGTIMMLYRDKMISVARDLTDSDPKQASELLNVLKNEMEKAEWMPEPSRKQSITLIDRSLQRIGPALKRAELLGKPAPLFDAEAWVNGDAVTTQDLKGKVVLLDFWAVWCGPCIATFPHLREWNQEYSDKGLVVIGVTSKYNYQWNEETKRAARGDEQSMDDEIAMLEKFLAHHELEHRSMVNPADSKMKSQYGVSGIPQAVLIDRSGIVRMIRVGSGEKNAKALHEMIEQLLQE